MTARTSPPRRHPRYRLATVAVAALAAGSAPAPATGQEPLPDDNAGAGQYIEPVPGAGGDRPAAPGSRRASGRLPSRTRDRLPSGEEGRALERIATDPGYGAPADGERADGERADGDADGGGAGRADRSRSSRSAGDDERSAVTAVVEAATGDDGPGVPLLILGMLALTLGAAAAARSRARRP